jgi:hypothetical protein
MFNTTRQVLVHGADLWDKNINAKLRRTEIILDPINEVELDFNGEKSKRPIFMSRYENAEKYYEKDVKFIVAEMRMDHVGVFLIDMKKY